MSYLNYIHGVSVKSPLLDFISIVHDFPNIFPIDIPGLPPDHDIKFIIKHDPGTRPISMALHRMTLAKLKKLNSHLQDLGA